MSAHSGGKRTKAAPRNKIWVAILALLTVLLLWSALRAEAVPAGQGIVPQAAYLDTSGPLYHYTDPTGNVIARTGVDVSSYQGDINWNAVREAGAEFAIVRGYPVLRRYALCRVLRPDGFTRRQHEGHDGLSCPSGGPARRLPGAAGTHGAQYAGAGTENKSLYADGAA